MISIIVWTLSLFRRSLKYTDIFNADILII